jgi:hypothetical protein
VTSVTIYVYLPEEAVDVWGPVEPELVAPGICRITSSHPEDEVWQFRSGDLVCYELRQLDGGEHLVAVARGGSNGSRSGVEVRNWRRTRDR